MWKHALILMLACSGAVFGQTTPDFSGVFLQTQSSFAAHSGAPQDPIVLKIEQEANVLRVTEFQNRTQATYVLDLSGEASPNIRPPDLVAIDRPRFSDGVLLIKSEISDANHRHELTEESWQLSSDLQVLIIKEQMEHANHPEWLPKAEYQRQATLPDVMERAAKASRMNNCIPTHPYRGKRVWKIRSRGPMTGIALDGTGLDELGAAYSFGVSLHGDFFADLDLIPKTGPIELRRKGDLVSNFSGPLFLTVNTAISWRPHSMIGMTPNSMGGWRFTDALRGLRVHLLWIGPVTRDMGEVPADLETYPVAKGQVLEGRYNMEVPVSDVPITDSLEIHILSPDGTQLGCINGHI